MRTPRIISINGTVRGVYGAVWYVTITTHMFEKLPEWVRVVLRSHGSHDNPKHTVLRIEAVDELQALVRFQQLWDCLPKEDK
jgi:hypothetical protein